jgi:hypothetical protein
MLQPFDVLHDARTRVADECRWCKGASARNLTNQIVHPEAGDAVKWCATGAVDAVKGADTSCLLGARNAVTYNDAPGRMHADILRLYDVAIGVEGSRRR